MKKAIIYLTICLIPIISLGQMQENVERIKKDKKGSIYAVEFPPDIEKSKRPKTTDSFFNRYLKVSPNDHFEKAPRTSKDKNFVHEHYNQYYRGINCF